MLTPTQMAGVLACFAPAVSAIVSGIKPYSQEALDNFNILKHIGGEGPYSTHPGYGLDTNPPSQCTVDQVQMFIRHGERYPTHSFGKQVSSFLQQIKDDNLTAIDELYWLNNYVSPALKDEYYDLETFEGPYSGYASMYKAGSDIRAKYGHLWNENLTLPIFTASQERIVVTSVNVARGFFGANWTQHAAFVVLNETEEVGLNSLTPLEGCPAFDGDYRGDWRYKYAEIGFEKTLKKLQRLVPGINATTTDVGNLLSLCMYDLNAAGSSPWCEYFDSEDWAAYDYFREIDYYYYSGNGNPTVPALGSIVANATLKIMQTEHADNVNDLYLSFSHEANILMLLTAFGVVNPDHDLPYEYPEFTSRWKTSNLVPMGARFAIERLSCANTTDPSVNEHFVRFVINDAVIPHDTCVSGPGFSCPIDEFVKITESRLQDPIEKCGINETYTYDKDLTFYWDWQANREKYANTVVDISQF